MFLLQKNQKLPTLMEWSLELIQMIQTEEELSLEKKESNFFSDWAPVPIWVPSFN